MPTITGGRLVALVIATVIVGSFSPAALAQCDSQWLDQFPFGDLDGEVRALVVFDDDGPGPHQPALYVGGSFSYAGGQHVRDIAKWDGVSWAPVGLGIIGSVYALAVFDDDGDGPHLPALYAGGLFTTAGGIAASEIAKWDGSSWSALVPA